MLERIRVFTGNANRELAEKICKQLGVSLGKANVTTFSDGETRVEINENVRGMDVFIIQSTCPPVNVTLMELLIMIDAMKRASVDRITAVVPYYGYARQDRKVSSRAPISAKLVADLITAAGANRVLAMDLHAGQIQGFFNIPVDNLFAKPVLLDYMKKHYMDNTVIVSPDAGGVERARSFGKRMDASLAIIDKRREGPNEAEAMNVIGDVKGKRVIILDDMIDTAGTIVEAANAMKKAGALETTVCCTHPVLSGPALDRIENSDIAEAIVTDTVPLSDRAQKCKKIKVLSVSGILSEAVRRIYYNDSVSSLFI
ncbi:MAG: ribose-phosphate pyrophosphokinase [Smithella sp.]